MARRVALSAALRSLEASLLAQLQYRADFLVQLAMGVFWAGWALAPLLLVYGLRPTIAGFDRDQAMLVLGAFVTVKALLDGLIAPNMLAVVEHVRRGTLDFVLLKPIDSQLLVSTQRVVASKLVDLAAGLGILGWALTSISPAPTPLGILLAASMGLAGLAVLYALWLMVVSLAFWFVKVDNLSYLFSSIFDAGRWPISVFRGPVRFLLTFVFPVALMTSYPALAALGRLSAGDALAALALAAAFLVASRRVWRWAVAHYSSASS